MYLHLPEYLTDKCTLIIGRFPSLGSNSISHTLPKQLNASSVILTFLAIRSSVVSL